MLVGSVVTIIACLPVAAASAASYWVVACAAAPGHVNQTWTPYGTGNGHFEIAAKGGCTEANNGDYPRNGLTVSTRAQYGHFKPAGAEHIAPDHMSGWQFSSPSGADIHRLQWTESGMKFHYYGPGNEPVNAGFTSQKCGVSHNQMPKNGAETSSGGAYYTADKWSWTENSAITWNCDGRIEARIRAWNSSGAEVKLGPQRGFEGGVLAKNTTSGPYFTNTCNHAESSSSVYPKFFPITDTFYFKRKNETELGGSGEHCDFLPGEPIERPCSFEEARCETGLHHAHRIAIGIVCRPEIKGQPVTCYLNYPWGRGAYEVPYAQLQQKYKPSSNQGVEGANGWGAPGFEPHKTEVLALHDLAVELEVEQSGAPAPIATPGWPTSDWVNPAAATCGATAGCVQLHAYATDTGPGVLYMHSVLNGTGQGGGAESTPHQCGPASTWKVAQDENEEILEESWGAYTVTKPCPARLPGSGTSALDVTGLGSLPQASHNEAYIAAGSATTDPGPELATSTPQQLQIQRFATPSGCPTGDHVTSIPQGIEGRGTTRWLRGEYTISATVCDGISGASEGRLYYEISKSFANDTEWGAPQEVCRKANTTATAQQFSFSCTYNTEPYSAATEGHYVRWLVQMCNNTWPAAECTGTEAASEARRIDNASPTVGHITKLPGETLSRYGWTDRKEWAVHWPQVNDACEPGAEKPACEGSGVAQLQYEVISHCHTAGDGLTEPTPPWPLGESWAKGLGLDSQNSTLPPPYPLGAGTTELTARDSVEAGTGEGERDEGEACEQGLHEIAIRARDHVDVAQGAAGPWKVYVYFLDTTGETPRELKVAKG